jgi:hypothetical protein
VVLEVSVVEVEVQAQLEQLPAVLAATDLSTYSIKEKI